MVHVCSVCVCVCVVCVCVVCVCVCVVCVCVVCVCVLCVCVHACMYVCGICVRDELHSVVNARGSIRLYLQSEHIRTYVGEYPINTCHHAYLT